jgi:multidrug efflux pump subunit AcrA (membrane-fusion protein)
MPTNVTYRRELAQATGKVLRWLKAPGDRVAKGDPIVEIETDKWLDRNQPRAARILQQAHAGRESSPHVMLDLEGKIRQ